MGFGGDDVSGGIFNHLLYLYRIPTADGSYMVNDDFVDIAQHASLTIFADDKVVEIRHKFNLRDQSIWGVMFFFCAGCFLMAASFISASDSYLKTFGMVIGLLICIVSTLTLIRQTADRISVTDTDIIFRYQLRRTTLPVRSNMKVKMKTDTMKVRNSTYLFVTHYLHVQNQEIPELNFQMEITHSDKAKLLGNEINRMINGRLQQFQ